jgi:hypothetical protein
MKIFLIFSFVFLSACSNPFGGNSSSVDSDHHPGLDTPTADVIPAGKGSEFISSSQQGILSSGGKFKVQASVSNMEKSLFDISSGATFKVFHGVQGELLSQDGDL